MLASYAGKHKCVSILLKHGADIEKRDKVKHFKNKYQFFGVFFEFSVYSMNENYVFDTKKNIIVWDDSACMGSKERIYDCSFTVRSIWV